MTIARLTVQRGDLTEYPLATRTKNGWQNGVTFYPDAEVTNVTELHVVAAEWEYGAVYQGDNGHELLWFSMGAGAFTVREAAEREVERFADSQVVLGRRTKPGAWERVPAPEPTDGTGK
jgi:hypothetical protein